MAMAPDELVHMVRACGLNRLVQYGTFVSAHIRAAQTDEDVKKALMGLRQILYTGVALGDEEATWAAKNDLRLTVSSIVISQGVLVEFFSFLVNVRDVRNGYVQLTYTT